VIESDRRSGSILSLLAPLALAALAGLTIGCDRRGDQVGVTQLSFAQLPVAQGQAAPPPPAQAQPQPIAAQPAAPRAPLGEQTLDTGVNPPPQAAPPPQGAPILTTRNLKTKVRTPDDEHLPKWVPVKGRLTVVDSSDLAENLGLVPKGTAKKSDERVSVADKLAEEADARRANAAPAQGVSASYAAGRVSNHRY
jgi:hypothetical protein